jgi:hypothetical protein
MLKENVFEPIETLASEFLALDHAEFSVCACECFFKSTRKMLASGPGYIRVGATSNQQLTTSNQQLASKTEMAIFIVGATSVHT